MIRELNKKSLAYGIPGMLLQGCFIYPPTALLGIFGTVLLIIGLSYYARAKGYSGYFGLLGLLSWIGIIVLITLKDRHMVLEEVQARKVTKTRDVVLGIILGLALVIGVPALIAVLFMLFVK